MIKVYGTRPLALLLAGLFSAGCDSVAGPAPALLWEGELVPVDVNDPLEGTVAMVAQSATQVGIGISNAPAQATLGWNVRTGTCDGAGDVLAPLTSFPPISTNADGNGTAEMLLNRRLGDGEYAAQLFADNSGAGVLIACGDLVRTTLQ